MAPVGKIDSGEVDLLLLTVADESLAKELENDLSSQKDPAFVRIQKAIADPKVAFEGMPPRRREA